MAIGLSRNKSLDVCKGKGSVFSEDPLSNSHKNIATLSGQMGWLRAVMMSFEQIVSNLFSFCVYVLQVIGGTPGEFGFGYYLANLLIFVVIQPGLILLFFMLWRREKRKNSR